MAVDEGSRLQLADAARRAFGDDAGITLMELLSPVGWADVATKQDLSALEARLVDRFDVRFERGFRQIMVAVVSVMVGGFAATTAAIVGGLLAR